MADKSSILSAALNYISRGWSPVPVPYRQKGPVIDAWQNLRITAETAPRYFNGALQNIGVILGPPSNGLTDIDLDCLEAVAAAPYFLCKTAIFGRSGKPASHWVYRTDLSETQDLAVIKFKGADKALLLELRMGASEAGIQTIFPPSTHDETGEPVEWTDRGPHEVADIDGADLAKRARRLAAAVELARNYAKAGGRHDAAFVLGGFLARCGFTKGDAGVFAEAVAVASGQPHDVRKDMIRTAKDGAETTTRAGFPKLAETFGDGAAKKVAEWLDYSGAGNPEDLGGGEVDRSSALPVSDFIAFSPDHTYIHRPTGETWTQAAVNSRVAPIDVGAKKPLAAGAWLDRNDAVEQRAWAPGKPPLINDELVAEGGFFDKPGARVFNTYKPPFIIPSIAGEIRFWRDHLRALWPDEADHIERWGAHRAQRPGEKINHGLVLGGKPGIGKDTLLEPVKVAVGPWNVAEVSPQVVLASFNEYVRSVICIISEGKDLGEFDQFAFYEATKTLMAAPPNALRVNGKFMKPYYAMNVTGGIITTNHKVGGLFLPPDDRRHHVAWSSFEPADFDHERFWAQLKRGGAHAVADHLRTLDISGFDPKAPPPKTQAFWEMANAMRSEEESEMSDILESLEYPKALVVGDVIARAHSLGPRYDAFVEFLKERKNSRLVAVRLEQSGYRRLSNPTEKKGRWRINGQRTGVYVLEKLTNREAFEAVGVLDGLGSRGPDGPVLSILLLAYIPYSVL